MLKSKESEFHPKTNHVRFDFNMVDGLTVNTVVVTTLVYWGYLNAFTASPWLKSDARPCHAQGDRPFLRDLMLESMVTGEE